MIRTLALAALVVAAAPAPARPAAPRDEGIIVALGDSLTAGLGVAAQDSWPAQLERRLRAEGLGWRVVNAGISGETSSGARARLGRVLGLEPDIVVLATGANDGLRRLPPEELYGNLDAILTTLRARHVTVVLAGMQLPREFGPAYATAFARVYLEAARRHRPVFIPFMLEGVAGDPFLNQPDGLHPTAAGYRAITDLVFPRVVEAIERVRSGRSRLPAQ